MEALTAEVGATGGRIQLVLLGDMLDLTELALDQDADQAVAASVARLGRIAAAHSAVFDALGGFLASGGRLRVVAGNHDLDLAQRQVQEEFRARLGGDREGSAHGDAVTFDPWFFHVPAVVYAEHGHRYHDINAVGIPDGSTVPGVHAPERTPLTAYVDAWTRALRTRNGLGRWTSLLLRRAVSSVVRRGQTGLREYQREDIRLDPATLAAIDGLTARVGPATLARVAGIVVGSVGRAVGAPALAATAGWLVLRNHRRSRVTATALAGLGGLVSVRRSWSRLWPPPRSTAYALDAARAVTRILERAGQRPAAVVLAHTHVPTKVSLEMTHPQSWYLNTGSWTPSVDRQAAYPYVRVSWMTSDAVRSDLLWWSAEAS